MPIQTVFFPPIPTDTARAAEAVFGKGNIYLIIGDQMEALFAGVDLAHLATLADKPAAIRAIHALVTAFQFAENIPDRRATEAVRTRVDWQYALHLPPSHSGLNQTTLCEFRRQALHDLVALRAFQQLLDHLAEVGLWRGADHQRVEAAEALMAVCRMTCLERLTEAMLMAMEALATRQPERLRAMALPYWYERYNRMLSTSLLLHSRQEQEELAQAIGADAQYLIDKIGGMDPSLASIPEVQGLWGEWHQQFSQSATEARWRSLCDVCADVIDSSNGRARSA